MSDLLITLILGVPFWILCGWAGRAAWRRYQMQHFPYDDRVEYGPKGWGMGGLSVPRIPPKGKGWF